jgi:hypothetical protein
MQSKYSYLSFMKKQEYRDGDCAVTVQFEDRSIHITNNKSLWTLLGEDIESRTAAFAAWIKAQYYGFFGKELDITTDSLIVEIWGHVYFEYYVLAIKELLKLKLIEGFLESILEPSEVIDCGESGLDNNRKLWDMLAPHKEFILKVLPGKIDPGKLKEQ